MKLSFTSTSLAIALTLSLGCSRSDRVSNSPTKSMAVDDRAPMEKEMVEMAPAPPSVYAEERSVAYAEHAMNTEAYAAVEEAGYRNTLTAPLSTFSIDVDTASYSNVRRLLREGTRPPAGAVRIEEFVNYFDYDYPAPKGEHPIAVYTELAPAPWDESHKLLHIGLKAKTIETEKTPSKNLVFLLDVSGSMESPDKLPLLKRAFEALIDTLTENDTVSIVVYAGASGVVLPPTNGTKKNEIRGALGELQAGGSTNGGEGIEVAYRLAQQTFKQGGVNRVILATDGDFNVGPSSESDLVKLIEEKRRSGVFLTTLGFGGGNYKDTTMELLADKGNGNYAYIDSLEEAKKVLVTEAGENLITVAKDVKIQIEFNPEFVGAYRLVGYENRTLAAEDFKNDAKDAGEMGAGHTVTALYELLTPEQAARVAKVDPLSFSRTEKNPSSRKELGHMKLRYKTPNGETSVPMEFGIGNALRAPSDTSETFRFSASVANFAMLLRGSSFSSTSSFDSVAQLAQGSLGNDRDGLRHDFLSLVARAKSVL